MESQAIVKVGNEAEWIYYKQVIQCFKCGWWREAICGSHAKDLHSRHICGTSEAGFKEPPE